MTEANPSPTIPVRLEPLSYAGVRPINRAARWALVAGLLGFLPLVPGIIAMIQARRAMRAANETAVGGHRMARVAWVLGQISVAFWACLALATPPMLLKAREMRHAACASNFRQIAGGLAAYSLDYNTVARSLSVLVNAPSPRRPPYLLSSSLICPECDGDSSKPPLLVGGSAPTHYVLVPAAPLLKLPSPQATVVAYEPLTNHDGRGSHFAFADGHAEWMDAPKAQAFIAEVTAGHNPPRAEMLPK